MASFVCRRVNSYMRIISSAVGFFVPSSFSKSKFVLSAEFNGAESWLGVCYSSSFSSRPLARKFLGSRTLCSSSAEGCNPSFDASDKQNQPHSADADELARVCKIVEDLFSSDRNMEAILDQCEVKLSHSLVIDVLTQFRLAWKPAFRFFCWASKRPGFSHNSTTYNAMMSILGKTRQFESMVVVFDEMENKKLLTIETFVISIKAFAAAKELKKAVALLECMKRYNFVADTDIFNSLLDALGREKLVTEAQILFERMKNKFPPNVKTYTVLIAGWCKVKNLLEAGRVWNEMTDSGLKPDIIAHNIMLEGLLSVHFYFEANKLFDLMKAKGPFPNVRSYTILIHNLTKRGKMKDAIEHLNMMVSSGLQPDPAVYTCLLVGFGNERQLDKVYAMLIEMKEKGCPPDGQTYNALIKMMTNRRMPDDAIRVYKKMVKSGFEPTIHTFNMLLKSSFQARNCEMGRAVWNEMMKKGCCPDDISYTALIGGLIANEKSEEACKYLEEMINKGMKVPQLDFDKFVADFSRAGKPNILSELSERLRASGKFDAVNMLMGKDAHRKLQSKNHMFQDANLNCYGRTRQNFNR